MCGLKRDTAVSSNCSNRVPLPFLRHPFFHLDIQRPALMCQSRFVRVIIILATILCRLQSLPVGIFHFSEEVKDGKGGTATDYEEDFRCRILSGWRTGHTVLRKLTQARSTTSCVQRMETSVRLIEQFVTMLCANTGPNPAPYLTASGAALCKTFDETHQSAFHWRCLSSKV